MKIKNLEISGQMQQARGRGERRPLSGRQRLEEPPRVQAGGKERRLHRGSVWKERRTDLTRSNRGSQVGVPRATPGCGDLAGGSGCAQGRDPRGERMQSERSRAQARGVKCEDAGHQLPRVLPRGVRAGAQDSETKTPRDTHPSTCLLLGPPSGCSVWRFQRRLTRFPAGGHGAHPDIPSPHASLLEVEAFGGCGVCDRGFLRPLRSGHSRARPPAAEVPERPRQ